MKRLHTYITLVCGTISLLTLGCELPQDKENIIYETESPYHHIKVIERDDGHYRDLVFGRVLQSSMKDNNPLHLVYPYSRSAFLSLTMVAEVNRALFVGMGAGTLSNVFRHLYPNVEIDIVDIDPYVFDVAEKYFHYKPDGKMTSIVEDGRIYLRETDKKYDLIFMDSFNEEGIPFHLTTKEFLEIAKSRLTPQGCIVSHYWGTVHNRLFHANIRTNQEVFGTVYLVESEQKSDFVLFATADSKTITKPAVLAKADQLMKQKKFSFDLLQLAEREFTGAEKLTPEETLLTDDYAPVNIMRHQESM